MRLGSRGFFAAVVAVTVMATGVTGVGVADAGKRKPRVTSVSVYSKSTIRLSTFPAPESDSSRRTNSKGMRFAGTLAFNKVELGLPRRAKLTRGMKTTVRKIEKRSRKTCVKLFTGGPGDRYTPKVQIWTHGGPFPAQPFISTRPYLVTRDFIDTEISGAGTKTVLWKEQAATVASWEERGSTWYGITPNYPIIAKGGWVDPLRGTVRDNSDTLKIRQYGRRTKITVNCSRFSATTEWKG